MASSSYKLKDLELYGNLHVLTSIKIIKTIIVSNAFVMQLPCNFIASERYFDSRLITIYRNSLVK